jgi:outer membrane protein assembly factor BamB
MKSSRSLYPSFRHGLMARVVVIGFFMAAGAMGIFLAEVSAAVDESGESFQEMAERVVSRLENPRGLGVVLGDMKAELALQLAKRSELTLFLQLPETETTESVRRRVDAQELYGNRIYVEAGSLERLHLADNLVDVLVASGPAEGVSEQEVLRVLRPLGQAWLGNKTITKPLLQGVDDWSHPYHGPDNNPVSKDQIARGPYWTQFLAEPRYAPLPQVAVASLGRVFKVFGHIAFKEREEPWLNTLAAFNGYNGAFLWRREITPGLMVHRNSIIATPKTLYFGDDKSCKLIDTATGQLTDEIAPPVEIAGGTFWKWMALENEVLYALLGEAEPRDPIIRMRSDKHGWPWDPLSPGFNQPEHPWGYGRTVLALDPKTKKVLWHHREMEPIDSRAMCLKSGRLFIFHQGSYLACLDVKSGQTIWRKTKDNDPALFNAFGPNLGRQDWRTNWRTTAYAKCSDRALYFAGPSIARLLAVSAEDGRILWQHPYDNYQLVLEDDALYGLSGQIDHEVSRKFDPLTGKVLQEIKLGRRACTRPTGAIDAIFCRANGGSTRLDLASGQPQLVSPMRAQCQDGVTIANGLLYWWPSVCDCNLTLYGITCLGPAGDFDFTRAAQTVQRLQRGADASVPADALPETPSDWPVFRANNTASATTEAVVPGKSYRLWQTQPGHEFTPTAPTAAAGLVFYGGSDGVVRALEAATGKSIWTAYTGGSIRFPPTLWKGRAYVGSGDGWVYCLEAKTGRMIWRFRGAPVERKIPVYGQLLSTWPASGIIIHEGVAFFAAGIVNYDGTYVYALDAVTGAIKWQNTTSGHLDPVARTGVSAQGNLIVHEGKLWLAGGNVVSPGVYDVATGKCLNATGQVRRMVNNNVPASESPRGSELYLVGTRVMVSDQPLYAHPKWKVYDSSVLEKTWVGSMDHRDFLWVNNAKIMCYPRLEDQRTERLLAGWGKPRLRGLEPVWETECRESVAIALCRNALVAAKGSELIAYNPPDGQPLWTQPLPGAPVPWGLAVDGRGRVLVSLENGQILCFGDHTLASARSIH